LRSSATASPTPFTSCSRPAGAPKTRSQRPEAVEQRLGDRLGIAARDQPEQHEFQQLVIGQRRVAMIAETLAQPFAMAVIMLFLGRLAVQRVWLASLFGKEGPLVHAAVPGHRKRQLLVFGVRSGAFGHQRLIG
jgi:hypothetical protein